MTPVGIFAAKIMDHSHPSLRISQRLPSSVLSGFEVSVLDTGLVASHLIFRS